MFDRTYSENKRQIFISTLHTEIQRCLAILVFEREERKRRRREEKEKKVTRAGIEPAAAAPSQPTRLDVSRSDHSAASKRNGFVTSFNPFMPGQSNFDG